MSAPTKVQLEGGAFQDAEGNVLAFGTLRMELVQDEQLSSDTGQLCSGITLQIKLDANGNVSTSPAQSVWPTDVMIPGEASYTVWGYSSSEQRVWGPNYNLLVPSGTTFDTGTWTPNSAGGGNGSEEITLQTNSVNNGSQSILNLHAGSNVTLTDNGSGQITIAASGGGSSLVLQTNETPNGSQTLLDLHAGSNITLTDNGSGQVTIAASGGGGFSTPGLGWIWSTQSIGDIGNSAIPSAASTLDGVYCCQMVLEASFTISKFLWTAAPSSGAASTNQLFGIYDSSGNLLVQAEIAVPNAGASRAFEVDVTPTLLPAGVYYFAFAGGGSNPGSLAINGGAVTSNIYKTLNGGGVVRVGQATNNLISAVAMPLTLGAILDIGETDIPYVIMAV